MKKKMIKNRLYKFRYFDSTNTKTQKIITKLGFFRAESANFYHFTHWVIEPKGEDRLELESLLKLSVIDIMLLKNSLPLQ